MIPVVLISDSSKEDVYLSILEYSISHQIPSAKIFLCLVSQEDNIKKSAANILLSNHSFNDNTIYFLEVNTSNQKTNQKILLIQYDSKWIISPDNGITGLLEKDKIQNIYYWKEFISSCFYAKNEQLNALKNLVDNNFSVSKDWTIIPFEDCEKIMWPNTIQRNSNQKEIQIIPPVMYIDAYQNIILKFKKNEYNELIKNYNVKISMPFYDIDKIYSTYNQEKNSDAIALFNDAGYLEIAINGAKLAPLIANKNIFSKDNYFIIIKLTPKL